MIAEHTEPCHKLWLRPANYFTQRLHFVSEQESATGQTGAEDVRYTLVIKRSSSRRSFTSTATWPDADASKSLTRCVWRSARSKSGSRTDAWNGRRRATWPPRWLAANRQEAPRRSERIAVAQRKKGRMRIKRKNSRNKEHLRIFESQRNYLKKNHTDLRATLLHDGYPAALSLIFHVNHRSVPKYFSRQIWPPWRLKSWFFFLCNVTHVLWE